MSYNINVTVNTIHKEYEYEVKMDSLDKLMGNIASVHQFTSVMLVVVPAISQAKD